MNSKIFAIAHIGKFSLYIGSTHQLKDRWEMIEQQLRRKQYAHAGIQQAWIENNGDCRFTFRTAQNIAEKPDMLGLHRFVDDLCEESTAAQAS